jgi:electron transfer flavoprotein subunit beta
MNILVLLKQVPNVSEITIDPQTLAIDRSRAVQVLNPEDLHALEAGLTLASQKQGSVTVLSMGPERCEAVLREGIGMGATNAVRVTDDSFVGSDTLITADVLKTAINHLGKFDAIFCGANSIDGNTSQIAGKLGAMLNIGTLTNASSIEFKEDEIEISRKAGTGYEKLSASFPLICSVTNDVNEPRSVSMKGRMAAKKAEIQVLDNTVLGIKDLKSPSRVDSLFAPEKLKVGSFVDGATTEEKVGKLISILSEAQAI